MPITVKTKGLSPPDLQARMLSVLHTHAAPVIGLYLVRQVEYSHDVQGRDEEDRHGVWPERKVPSSGLLVFGDRKAVSAAIKKLDDLDKQGLQHQKFTIKRAAKSLGAGRSEEFSRRQVLGAKLALEQEAKRARFNAKAKTLAGLDNKKAVYAKRKEVRAEAMLALTDGRLLDAKRKFRQLALMAGPISKGRSYRTAATYLPRPVLLRTGTMKSSWTYRVERQSDMVVVYIGTPVKYAKYHELGKGVPLRRQVVVSRQDKAKIAALTGDVMQREL